jgi:NADPH:quinone reductase-like Zn-dependent oxidoreductase
MKALVLTSPGKIELIDVATPTLTAGKALVKIKSAALNRRDDWIREGKYPNIKFGVTMGSDGAGVVEDVFEESDREWIGKEVIINPNIDWGNDPEVQSKNYTILGMPFNGTFAEKGCTVGVVFKRLVVFVYKNLFAFEKIFIV